jgi:hypothetical protein
MERAVLRCAASCLSTRQTTIVANHRRLVIVPSFIIFAIDSSHSRLKLVSFTAGDTSQAPSSQAFARDCHTRRHHLHRARIKRRSLCTTTLARRILPSSASERTANHDIPFLEQTLRRLFNSATVSIPDLKRTERRRKDSLYTDVHR